MVLKLCLPFLKTFLTVFCDRRILQGSKKIIPQNIKLSAFIEYALVKIGMETLGLLKFQLDVR